MDILIFGTVEKKRNYTFIIEPAEPSCTYLNRELRVNDSVNHAIHYTSLLRRN